MNEQTYSYGMEHAIKKETNSLLDIFTKGSVRADRIQKIMNKLELLDKANEQFREFISSVSAQLKMMFYLCIAAMCIPLDFAVMFHGLELMVHAGWVLLILQICVPFGLIMAEIGISYIAFEKQNNGEYLSWIYRNLQFCVLCILFAFSVTAVVYSCNGYDPRVDHTSFGGYLFGVLIEQAVLLGATLLVHVWVIKHARDIGDALAFFSYKFKRDKLAAVRMVNEMRQKKKEARFVKGSCRHTQQLSLCAGKYGLGMASAIVKTIPESLIMAINKAMGKDVFAEYRSNNPKRYEP